MKGNCMSLDSKWLVCSLSKKKKKKVEVRSGVNIIHHYSVSTLVTGCHHHQTDPQNLGTENKKT